MNKKFLNIFSAILLFAALSTPQEVCSMVKKDITFTYSWGEWFTGLARTAWSYTPFGVKKLTIDVLNEDELTKGYTEEQAQEIKDVQIANTDSAELDWEVYLSGKGSFNSYQLRVQRARNAIQYVATEKITANIKQTFIDKLNTINIELSDLNQEQESYKTSLNTISEKVNTLESKIAEYPTIQSLLNKDDEFTELLLSIKNRISAEAQLLRPKLLGSELKRKAFIAKQMKKRRPTRRRK